MSSEELKGKAKQIEGKAREEVGKTTHDASEEVKGKSEQIEGKVQEEVGGQIPEGPPRVAQVTQESKTTVEQRAETSETVAHPGGAQQAANTSGQAVGAGLKKVANVLGQFSAGISKGMDAGQQPKQEVRQAQETQEAPQTFLTEEEKVKKKEVRQQ